MIRGFGNAIIFVVIASLIDRYFYAGHYTVAMLQQIRHSLGL
jgi:hypothetical protein